MNIVFKALAKLSIMLTKHYRFIYNKVYCLSDFLTLVRSGLTSGHLSGNLCVTIGNSRNNSLLQHSAARRIVLLFENKNMFYIHFSFINTI